MPSKKRIKKAKEADEAFEKLGPIPNYAKEPKLGNPITLSLDGSRTIYDGGLVAFDEEGGEFLHPNHNKGAQKYNKTMSKFREEDALNLKDKYPELWSKRGAAGKIAEVEDLNIRTVQKYFKDFP